MVDGTRTQLHDRRGAELLTFPSGSVPVWCAAEVFHNFITPQLPFLRCGEGSLQNNEASFMRGIKGVVEL